MFEFCEMICLMEIDEIYKLPVRFMLLSLVVVLNHDLKVSEEVWQRMIMIKYDQRFRNMDDTLRSVLGMKIVNPPVKNYSDEGGNNAESTDTKKCPARRT
jgi:hypothetical protein